MADFFIPITPKPAFFWRDEQPMSFVLFHSALSEQNRYNRFKKIVILLLSFYGDYLQILSNKKYFFNDLRYG